MAVRWSISYKISMLDLADCLGRDRKRSCTTSLLHRRCLWRDQPVSYKLPSVNQSHNKKQHFGGYRDTHRFWREKAAGKDLSHQPYISMVPFTNTGTGPNLAASWPLKSLPFLISSHTASFLPFVSNRDEYQTKATRLLHAFHLSL